MTNLSLVKFVSLFNIQTWLNGFITCIKEGTNHDNNV